MIELSTVEEIRRCTADHPLLRLYAGDRVSRAWAVDGAVLWLAGPPGRVSAVAHGDAAAVAGLTGRLWRDAALAGVSWLNLPRSAVPQLTGLPTGATEDWDFRWTTAPPPPVPGADRVRVLGRGYSAGINRILDAVGPERSIRPGAAPVRRWYGILDGDRPVACLADVSRAQLGVLAAVAVHPAARRRGLGAALTAAVTGHLLTEYDTVGLGVLADNQPAIRLYRRMGYADVAPRTSAALRGPA
jgi:GNAT superfamily N-acetyltransferase